VAAARIAALDAELAATRHEADALYALVETRVGQPPSGAQAAAQDDDERVVHGRPARVLHLALNPTAAALREHDQRQAALVAALKSEAAALRTQLAAAHAQLSSLAAQLKENDSKAASDLAAAQAQAAAAVAAAAAASAAPAQPTNDAADVEKLRQRLKEVFKERIATLRDAVHRLTGWKVDMTFSTTGDKGATNLILRNMYAEREGDYLHFTLVGDTLDLLESDYAKRLDPKNFAYLTMYKSFPAFLGQLTLDLFDKQTVMAATASG
jgi:hypothetical protein